MIRNWNREEHLTQYFNIVYKNCLSINQKKRVECSLVIINFHTKHITFDYVNSDKKKFSNSGKIKKIKKDALQTETL